MFPLVLGAVGAAWLVSKFVPNREAIRRNFPFVPYEWWSPRDRFFTLKERAFVQAKALPRLNDLYESYAAAHPEHSYGLFLRSLAAMNGRDPRQAAEHARALIDVGPASVGWWRLAACAKELGDRELMIEASRRFLELEPDSELRPSIEATIATLEREQKPAPARTAKLRKPRARKSSKPRKKPASAKKLSS